MARSDQKHEHEWVVFSTALAEAWLMVQCVRCGAMGTVDKTTAVEWSQAFHPPRKPYRWDDGARVTMRHEVFSDFYVVPKQPGKDCQCPCAVPDLVYERVPIEITRRCWNSNRPIITATEEKELGELATFVAGSDLCSFFSPVFMENYQRDTGRESSAAVREITRRIKDIRKGTHLRPGIVALLLREFSKSAGQERSSRPKA